MTDSNLDSTETGAGLEAGYRHEQFSLYASYSSSNTNSDQIDSKDSTLAFGGYYNF